MIPVIILWKKISLKCFVHADPFSLESLSSHCLYSKVYPCKTQLKKIFPVMIYQALLGKFNSSLHHASYYYAFITLHLELPACISVIVLDDELPEAWDYILFISVLTVHEEWVLIKYIY